MTGTTDCSVEVRALDKTSTTNNVCTDCLDSELMPTRQTRANLQRQIKSLDKKLMRVEENFNSEENDGSYERTLRGRRYLAEVLEELRSDRLYDDTFSIISVISTPIFIGRVASGITYLLFPDETHTSTCHSIKRRDLVIINSKATKGNLIYFSSFESEVSQDDEFTHSNVSEDLTALLDLDDIKYPLYTNEEIGHLLPPVNPLLWIKDTMGACVIFSTLDGRVQKFYTKVIGNKIRTKLNKLEDILRWCSSIREFTIT